MSTRTPRPRQGCAAARHARPPDPSHAALRAPARPGHRPHHRTAGRRRAAGRSRLALSGAAAARSTRLDRRRMGDLRNNRKARFYTLTKAGRKQLTAQTRQWRRLPPPSAASSAPRGRSDVVDRRRTTRTSREIDAHLSIETDRLIADGMTPERRGDAARRAFGNPRAAQERFHETNHWMWLEQLGQDLRYAARGLWHSRAFTATTVLTLAVGLGLVTVVFAISTRTCCGPSPTRSLQPPPDRLERAPQLRRQLPVAGLPARPRPSRPVQRRGRGRHALCLVGQPAGLDGVCLGQLLRGARRARPAGASAGQFRRRRLGRQPGRRPER